MAVSDVVKQPDQLEHPREHHRPFLARAQKPADRFGVDLEIDFDMSETVAVHRVRIGRLSAARLSTHYALFDVGELRCATQSANLTVI